MLQAFVILILFTYVLDFVLEATYGTERLTIFFVILHFHSATY